MTGAEVMVIDDAVMVIVVVEEGTQEIAFDEVERDDDLVNVVEIVTAGVEETPSFSQGIAWADDQRGYVILKYVVDVVIDQLEIGTGTDDGEGNLLQVGRPACVVEESEIASGNMIVGDALPDAWTHLKTKS